MAKMLIWKLYHKKNIKVLKTAYLALGEWTLRNANLVLIIWVISVDLEYLSNLGKTPTFLL